MTTIQRAAKVLIRRRSDGRYLVLTCSLWPDNPRRSQQPDLPGGNIEPHEHIEEGLLREVYEETGLTLAAHSLRLGYCFTRFARTISTNFLLYVGEIDDDDIILSWEHESYRWLSADDLKAMSIRDPYKEMFRYLASIELLV